jgi:hypothetical protein
MPKGRKHLLDKKEERDLPTTVRKLAPLFDLVLRLLEIILKLAGIIK